jgi:hypothetical protein
MREEVECCLGTCPPERKGERIATFTCELTTSSDLIDDLHIPRDRAGDMQTQVYDRLWLC